MEILNTIATDVGGVCCAVYSAANLARDLGKSMWVWPGEAHGLWLGEEWRLDDKRPSCHCIEVTPSGSALFQYPDHPLIMNDIGSYGLEHQMRCAAFDALHQSKRDMFVYAVLRHDKTEMLYGPKGRSIQTAWVYGPFLPANYLYFRVRPGGCVTMEIAERDEED